MKEQVNYEITFANLKYILVDGIFEIINGS